MKIDLKTEIAVWEGVILVLHTPKAEEYLDPYDRPRCEFNERRITENIGEMKGFTKEPVYP